MRATFNHTLHLNVRTTVPASIRSLRVEIRKLLIGTASNTYIILEFAFSDVHFVINDAKFCHMSCFGAGLVFSSFRYALYWCIYAVEYPALLGYF